MLSISFDRKKNNFEPVMNMMPIYVDQICVRDGIHTDADYNSSRMGVGVVVFVGGVVIAIFTMGYLENTLSYPANFLNPNF